MNPPKNQCLRASGTPRAWFATHAEAIAFAADPANPDYHGDVPVPCAHPGCEGGWHLSQPWWPDAVAARRAVRN